MKKLASNGRDLLLVNHLASKRLLVRFQLETQIPLGVVSGRASSIKSSQIKHALVAKEQLKVNFFYKKACLRVQAVKDKGGHKKY